MALDVKLRKEGPEDTRPVECLLREAFWNVYVPGCEEHYLAHILRKHRDFFVILKEGLHALDKKCSVRSK